MTTDPVLFVDTETLGLDPDIHPIWEIGCIEADGTEHEWQIALPAYQIAQADPVALEINRFEERYVGNLDTSGTEVLTTSQSAARFAELAQGKHLVGAVVSFDEERLRLMHNAFLGKPQGKYPWHYHVLCVEAMAVGHLGGSFELPWKSDAITKALGLTIDEENKHSALADARWARDIYMAVRG